MAEQKKTTGSSHATKLVNLMTRNGAELFRSPEGDPYVTVPVGEHRETMSLTGRPFRQYLAREYFLAAKKGVSASAIKDATTILCGSALLRGVEYPVFNRVAAVDGAVYLDLGRTTHEVVKVTAAGWEVVTTTEVRFCRRPGVMALPVPIHSDRSVEDLVQAVLNIRDLNDTRLLIAFKVAALRGRKPFPVLFVKGESGSGKTFGADLIRRVVDPNQANSTRLPKEARDLMIAARNSYLLSFDNLSFLPDWLSDDLCSLATGAGFRTRALTTDDEEAIFSAARPIVLNGIPDVISRDDLMSRSIVITLDSIPDERRKTEQEVEAVFWEVHPLLLGRLLDAVAGALAHEGSVRPPKLPRMADLVITMTAAESAIGWPSGTFASIYEEQGLTNIEALLDGNPIVEGLLALQRPWVGTLDDLMKAIRTTKNEAQLPKTARGLGQVLRRLVTSLRRVGIVITLPKKQERSGALRGKRIVSVADAGRLPFEGEHDEIRDSEAA